VKWLAEYGTLDNLLAHANDIKGVVGDNLRAARDWLPRHGRCSIKCDVALPFDFDDLTLKPRDTDVLRTLFERYEFRSWLRELDAAATANPELPEQDASGDHRTTTKRSSATPARRLIADSKRHRRLRSTPRPPASTQCSRTGRISFASPTAKPPTCRWHITMPAHRRSSTAPPHWRN